MATTAADGKHWRMEELASHYRDDTYQATRTALQALVHDPEYGFYAQQWVDYHKDAKQFRLKCCHDIRLKDGREFTGAYPNANSWHVDGSTTKITDDDVTHIRISKKQLGD